VNIKWFDNYVGFGEWWNETVADDFAVESRSSPGCKYRSLHDEISSVGSELYTTVLSSGVSQSEGELG
jgi:hypothetical protein